MCTLVKLSDHVFFMDRLENHLKIRNIRDMLIHKPGPFEGTGVPEEYPIWSTGAKVLHSLVPHIGINKVRDHVEINRYALLHICLTKILGTALAEEQKATCMIVLQNRLTLDLITASQGGVCKLIGEKCCTFIPDGYSKGDDVY